MSREFDLKAVSHAFERIALRNNWQALHTPQNLASAISVEAAELLSLFQWSGTRDGRNVPSTEAVASELADLVMYTNALADVLGIDLVAAVAEKCRHNEARFADE